MIVKSRTFYPMVCLLLSSFGLMAQEAGKMTLRDAINYAWANNNVIKDAQINIVDADEQIIENRAFGLPQLTGEANFQRYVKRPPLPSTFTGFSSFFEDNAVRFTELGIVLPPAPENGADDSTPSIFFKNNLSLGLNLDAMIFDGSFFTGMQAARAYRSVVAQEKVVKERQVKYSVIDAYLPLLLIHESLEILERNITNLEALLFETQELYKAGFVEQLDIDRQELSLVNLRTDRDNLVRQREVAMNILKFAMGYPMDEELEIVDDLESMAIAASTEDLTSAISYESRPDYELVGQSIELNMLNVKFNKSVICQR